MELKISLTKEQAANLQKVMDRYNTEHLKDDGDSNKVALTLSHFAERRLIQLYALNSGLDKVMKDANDGGRLSMGEMDGIILIVNPKPDYDIKVGYARNDDVNWTVVLSGGKQVVSTTGLYWDTPENIARKRSKKGKGVKIAMKGQKKL